jgi:hypothetical protein
MLAAIALSLILQAHASAPPQPLPNFSGKFNAAKGRIYRFRLDGQTTRHVHDNSVAHAQRRIDGQYDWALDPGLP